MILQTSIATFSCLRASLVIAALISLCVSNNVGPRFLPLPQVSDQLAIIQNESQNNATSRLPSRDESDNFRVPMMAQTLKRAGTEQQPQPLATFAPKGCLELPDDARATGEFDCTIPLFASATVSQPPGRAPPRLG
jgi:hypothetical protein